MSVGNVLTTIAACTGAGAFVDFYIGKSGQKRVRDWLETWRYRLSDIPVRAVGREEARNALRAIDYLFGPKLFSLKRLISAITCTLMLFVIYPGIYTTIKILIAQTDIQNAIVDMLAHVIIEVISVCILLYLDSHLARRLDPLCSNNRERQARIHSRGGRNRRVCQRDLSPVEMTEGHLAARNAPVQYPHIR